MKVFGNAQVAVGLAPGRPPKVLPELLFRKVIVLYDAVHTTGMRLVLKMHVL